MGRKKELQEIRKIVFGKDEEINKDYIICKDGSLMNEKRNIYKQMKKNLKKK